MSEVLKARYRKGIDVGLLGTAHHEAYLIECEQKEEHQMLCEQLDRFLGYNVIAVGGKHDPHYLHFEVRLPKRNIIIKKVHGISWQIGILYDLSLIQVKKIIDIIEE